MNSCRILLVNLGLLLVGLVAMELLFGGWISGDELARLNILRSRTIKFNVQGFYSSLAPTITYSRDEYGLRGSYSSPGDIDILTVGGSTTDQRYIDDEDTWQAVLERKLSSSGRTIFVANAGVDGQSTFGHIKNFDWWFPHVPGLQPTIVIFYIGLNDFHVEMGYGYDALIPVSGQESTRELLRENSAIYHLARVLYGIYQAEIGQDIGHQKIDFGEKKWTRIPLAGSYDDLMRQRLGEYAERLEILIDKTQAIGAVPVFVTQPSYRYRQIDGVLEGTTDTFRYEGVAINGVDYRSMLRRLDGVTCAVAAGRGVPCIDLGRELIWDEDDFYDYSHMTPEGAEKVGAHLFAEMVALFPAL